MTFAHIIDNANSQTMGYLEGDFRGEEIREIAKKLQIEKPDDRNLKDLMERLHAEGFTVKWIPMWRIEY